MVIDSIWFTNLRGDTIGIVLTKNGEGEIKCWVGNSPGMNEEADSKIIAEWGAPFPIEAAKALFPNHFQKEDGYHG